MLTLQGEQNSHAAVEMRKRGKAAVVAAQELLIDFSAGTVTSSHNPDKCVHVGETITIDFGGKSRRLERPEGAIVTPAGRPDGNLRQALVNFTFPAAWPKPKVY